MENGNNLNKELEEKKKEEEISPHIATSHQLVMRDRAKVESTLTKTSVKVTGTPTAVSRVLSNPLHPTWQDFASQSQHDFNERRNPTSIINLLGDSQYRQETQSTALHIALQDGTTVPSESALVDIYKRIDPLRKNVLDSQGVKKQGSYQELYVREFAIKVSVEDSDINNAPQVAALKTFFPEVTIPDKKLIICQGPSGSGKSTLALKLLKDWANSRYEPWQPFSAVYLIPLKYLLTIEAEKIFVKSNNLSKLLLKLLERQFNDALQNEMNRKLATELNESTGRTLYILDGLDTLLAHCTKPIEDNYVLQWIRTLLKQNYCIITTQNTVFDSDLKSLLMEKSPYLYNVIGVKYQRHLAASLNGSFFEESFQLPIFVDMAEKKHKEDEQSEYEIFRAYYENKIARVFEERYHLSVNAFDNFLKFIEPLEYIFSIIANDIIVRDNLFLTKGKFENIIEISPQLLTFYRSIRSLQDVYNVHEKLIIPPQNSVQLQFLMKEILAVGLLSVSGKLDQSEVLFEFIHESVTHFYYTMYIYHESTKLDSATASNSSLSATSQNAQSLSSYLQPISSLFVRGSQNLLNYPRKCFAKTPKETDKLKILAQKLGELSNAQIDSFMIGMLASHGSIPYENQEISPENLFRKIFGEEEDIANCGYSELADIIYIIENNQCLFQFHSILKKAIIFTLNNYIKALKEFFWQEGEYYEERAKTDLLKYNRFMESLLQAPKVRHWLSIKEALLEVVKKSIAAGGVVDYEPHIFCLAMFETDKNAVKSLIGSMFTLLEDAYNKHFGSTYKVIGDAYNKHHKLLTNDRMAFRSPFIIMYARPLLILHRIMLACNVSFGDECLRPLYTLMANELQAFPSGIPDDKTLWFGDYYDYRKLRVFSAIQFINQKVSTIEALTFLLDVLRDVHIDKGVRRFAKRHIKLISYVDEKGLLFLLQRLIGKKNEDIGKYGALLGTKLDPMNERSDEILECVIKSNPEILQNIATILNEHDQEKAKFFVLLGRIELKVDAEKSPNFAYNVKKYLIMQMQSTNVTLELRLQACFSLIERKCVDASVAEALREFRKDCFDTAEYKYDFNRDYFNYLLRAASDYPVLQQDVKEIFNTYYPRFSYGLKYCLVNCRAMYTYLHEDIFAAISGDPEIDFIDISLLCKITGLSLKPKISNLLLQQLRMKSSKYKGNAARALKENTARALLKLRTYQTEAVDAYITLLEEDFKSQKETRRYISDISRELPEILMIQSNDVKSRYYEILKRIFQKTFVEDAENFDSDYRYVYLIDVLRLLLDFINTDYKDDLHAFLQQCCIHREGLAKELQKVLSTTENPDRISFLQGVLGSDYRNTQRTDSVEEASNVLKKKA